MVLHGAYPDASVSQISAWPRTLPEPILLSERFEQAPRPPHLQRHGRVITVDRFLRNRYCWRGHMSLPPF